MIPSTAWSSGASSKTMFAALPPSSSVRRLPVPASVLWIAFPTSVDPVNAILSTPGWRDELRAGAAVAGDDVHDARRQLGLSQDIAEQERGERGRLGGLEHDGVAGGERGRDLPREHQQREVPRDDLARDADRPRLPIRERVLELVRPARVVEEVRGRERDVDVARFADGLAAVERFEDGELACALLQDPGDAEEVFGAFARAQLRPRAVERAARGLHRLIDVGLARLRDLGERLLARGIDRRVALAVRAARRTCRR